MTSKIRLGLIGAGPWAGRAHLPALAASADFELTAVCTTRADTAEAARQKHGARLAFHDVNALVNSPDVDAVAVVVKVPHHYALTRAALAAGKHVYTEWPLGKSTAEALELADLARARDVQAVVGLQSRMSPALVHMKHLIDNGYIGAVTACRVHLMREGILQRPSSRSWQRDASLGANTLTIPNGHTIDALRFVAGEFSHVAGVVSTQVHQWRETDTGAMVEVTSPDNVLVSGRLAGGGVASLHVATVQWAGSGYRMEIYGQEGTLVASGVDSPQLCELQLQGARDANALDPIALPAELTSAPATVGSGEPFNVFQMYRGFANAIRTGRTTLPGFDTAVQLHRLVDAIAESSATGREVACA
jgi:hypothetical protein